MKKIVVMPGGFHPFHAGHYALYQSALKAFPDADVYVAATNDQKARPFPFPIKEKLAKVAGVKPGRFIQVKSPFKAEEITSHYNPNEDVLIFVRSEKDKNESPKPGGIKKDGTPAYFQPYTGKNLQPFSKHAYFAYLPTVEFGPGIKSATEIRNAWPNLDERQKLAFVFSLYPATQKNKKLAQNVVQLLDIGMGGDSGLGEDINDAERVAKGKLTSDDVRRGYYDKAIQAISSPNATTVEKNKAASRYFKIGKITDPKSFKDVNENNEEQKEKKKQDDDDFIVHDPETERILNYVKQHYPNSKTKQQAFMKYVQRQLMHNSDVDNDQALAINRLEQELAQIKQALQRPQVAESHDYIEEK